MIVYAVLVLAFALLLLYVTHRYGRRTEETDKPLPRKAMLGLVAMCLILWLNTLLQAWKLGSEPLVESYVLVVASAVFLGLSAMWIGALRARR